MNSKIIGLMKNIDDFNDDINEILNFTNSNSDYNEFKVGDWRTYVIRNSSGVDGDGLIQLSDQKLKLTPQGKRLNNINNWIDTYFNTELLRLVRVHSIGEHGVLVPHRDFLELSSAGNNWFRVHIPIKTNENCLHAEDADVFHMRTGEIWFLDASNLHSATNFSSEQRLNLCLDFEINHSLYQNIFKYPIDEKSLPYPNMIKREPMSAEFKNGLLSLSKIICKHNYWDIIGLLSKLVFYKNISLSCFFDLILNISEQSENEYIILKSVQFCQFLKAERKMHERFTL